MGKDRSATQKTLYALEHHAKPLKEIVAVLTMYLTTSKAWTAASDRGGPNSWRIIGPDGKHLLVRYRRVPYRIEISDGTTLKTRLDAIKWCEKVLV